MDRTVVCRTAQDMENLGREIGKTCKGGSVISLRGSLGAGKTVFAKGVARSLGIEEAIVSPTFTLVQEYDGSLPMYHITRHCLTAAFAMHDTLARKGDMKLTDFSEYVK